MFIDKAKITVKAGNGGDGCMSFRREKYVPRGGPDGGDGGVGGDVILEASSHLKTLLDFKRFPVHKAKNGTQGQGRKKYGKDGEDLTLKVPCGTEVKKNGNVLCDLLKPGERFLICKGGRGGRGNVRFKSSVRQAPRIAERGEPGEEKIISLRLKLIADVGLVGMPNAGKSTLLSRFTRANPKIGDYPFTTLTPNLGVVKADFQEIIFSDIPGLIEGSHAGKGLGHQFLQHVERTRILVHVVDPMGFGQKSAKENIKIIKKEIKQYSAVLAKRPEIIVINKQDLTGADKIFKQIKKAYPRKKVMAISGVSGKGIPELIAQVAKECKKNPTPHQEKKELPPQKINLEPEFWVERQNGSFVVRGKKVELLIKMTNFDLEEALKRTTNILKKMGVEKSLHTAGAQAGDPVLIADFEFTFDPKTQMAGSTKYQAPNLK